MAIGNIWKSLVGLFGLGTEGNSKGAPARLDADKGENKMKKYIALAIVLVTASACGTFQLGYSKPQRGQTQEQMQLDMLTCKDQAYMAASSSERQAGAFLLGLTIIGTPLAYELDRKTQREVFGGCMQARGYEYTPPAN